MKATTYFKKNGEIYGIEQPEMFCGYVTKVIRFTDYNEAIRWATEKTDAYRFLGTKSDAFKK